MQKASLGLRCPTLNKTLIFIILWAYSTDDKLVIFFLFFPENRIKHFKQIISIGGILHEILNLSFGKTKRNIPKCRLQKIYFEY